MDLGPLIIQLFIRLMLILISTYLTTSIIRNQRKVVKLLIILISLRAILQTIQSYTSFLRPCMPAFKILIKLKLRIQTGLIIGSLIIITTRVRIRVRTQSLIRGLIGRKHGYSLYRGAAYPKQQLRPPYKQASVMSMTLQSITTGRSKRALTPPYCGLTLIERQEPANYILLLFCLLRSIIQPYLIVSRRYQFKPPLLEQLSLILIVELYINY